MLYISYHFFNVQELANFSKDKRVMSCLLKVLDAAYTDIQS